MKNLAASVPGKKFLAAGAIAAMVAIGVAACTPQQAGAVAVTHAFPEPALNGIAQQIVECESHHNPSAVNPSSGATGLFQIMPMHEGLVNAMGYSWSDMTNPFVNAEVARALFNRAGGWSPWQGVCTGRLGI